MKNISKESIALDAEKWDIYKIIDFTVAFILVVVSLVSADIPRQRIEIVKKSAPYVARGWTPSGQQLNLPIRSTPLPTPAPSYGPPQDFENITTEEPTTEESTENLNLSQQAENLEETPKEEKSEKVEKLEEQQGQQQFYVVLPQSQNVIYTIPRTAALLAVSKADLMAAGPARLQAVPLSSTVASSVYTPFSASYIQIYQ